MTSLDFNWTISTVSKRRFPLAHSHCITQPSFITELGPAESIYNNLAKYDMRSAPEFQTTL